MTSAEQLFRAALEELAAEGNQKAAFALSTANRLPTRNFADTKRLVTEKMSSANTSLLNALNSNDTRWTKVTDRYINDAQEHIMSAMRILAS